MALSMEAACDAEEYGEGMANIKKKEIDAKSGDEGISGEGGRIISVW